MKNTTMTLAAIVLGMIALGSLSACNTVDGLGQDFESAGRSIQKASQ